MWLIAAFNPCSVFPALITRISFFEFLQASINLLPCFNFSIYRIILFVYLSLLKYSIKSEKSKSFMFPILTNPENPIFKSDA